MFKIYIKGQRVLRVGIADILGIANIADIVDIADICYRPHIQGSTGTKRELVLD